MMPREQLDHRFELDQPIGTGGMGTVFRARDSISGGTVAVKILSDGPGHLAERFAREVKVLAAPPRTPGPWPWQAPGWAIQLPDLPAPWTSRASR